MHLLSRQMSTVGPSTSDAALCHSVIYKHMMLRSRAVGASVRNGMDGPLVGAALTNAEPVVVSPVVPLGLEAPSLHLLPHELPHTEFTVNDSTALAMSASSDLLVVIIEPRALPNIMEQLFWITATMYGQVTMGNGVVVVVGALASLRAVVISKPSSHGVPASSHCETRHSTYVAIMVGLVALDGTAQPCVLFLFIVVVVVVVVVK